MISLQVITDNKEKIQEYFNNLFINKKIPSKILLPSDEVSIRDFFIDQLEPMRKDLYDGMVLYLSPSSYLETSNPTTEEKDSNTVKGISDRYRVIIKESEIIDSELLILPIENLTIPLPNSRAIRCHSFVNLESTIVSMKALTWKGNNFLPKKAHGHDDTGFDCFAFIVDKNNNPVEKIVVKPGEVLKIPLGFSHKISSYVRETYSNGLITKDRLGAQLRPRSSLSSKKISCSFGTLDPIWDDQNIAVITNNSSDDFIINFHDKICQLCYEWFPLISPDYEIYSTCDFSVLNGGTRGGFGSTGR